jgi:hypothetical protein
MFEKTIEFNYGDNNSEVFTLVHPDVFVKTAEYSEELAEFIADLKPDKNKTYALVNALSAGEFYGPNRKGDYFPEESLKQYHKTFEVLGHVYKHHINKDPNMAIGKVVYSHYNSKMHRVELILELDNVRARDVIVDLSKGKLPKVSMGCRVPWDECSICGYRARSAEGHCVHAREQMNKVLPGGRKVYVKNVHPKFFDISVVTIPADQTAGFLKKLKSGSDVKEDQIKLASYKENNYINLVKLSEIDNLAEMKKQIEGKLELIPEKLAPLAEAKLTKDVLEKTSAHELLSTCLGLRIMPDLASFAKIAESVKDAEEVLSKVSLDNFNEKIAKELIEDIAQLACTKNLIVTRGLIKNAQVAAGWQPEQPPAERSLVSRVFFGNEPNPPLTPEQNPIVPLGILGTLYYGYAKVFNNPSQNGFREFIAKNPWLLPVLVGGAAIGTAAAQDNLFQKQASSVDRFFRNSLIAFPVFYIAAGNAENKAQHGEPISRTQNFVRKHPALTSLVASLGATKAETLLRKSFDKVATLVSQMPEEQVDKLLLDL